MEVSLHQQVNSLFAVLHSSRGIDTRSHFKHDITHAYLLSSELTHLDDCLHSHRWGLVELFQSVEGQYAVFSHHVHYVGGDAHGTQVEQRDESREGYAVVFSKSLHEFESHATSREVMEGVGRVSAFRVEDSHSRWHHLVGHMMVADDEVDAPLLSIGYFLYRLDTAVEHDDELYLLLHCIVDALDTHAISLFISVGDIVFNVRVKLL